MAADDDLALARARGKRWLPARRLASLKAAGRFIDDVGFALLFPADGALAPSLYEAVAGPDAVAWATGMGEAESTVWTWKDALPLAGSAWSGKFIYRRGSLLSPRLLSLLYPGEGELDDHRRLDLGREAHRIADALLTGPLPSSALRELVGDRNRYDRAITELQRQLLVTAAGVHEQRSGWPATIIDLTVRRFEVGGGPDRAAAAGTYLGTVLAAKPAQLTRAFGWDARAARQAMDGLVEAGTARQVAGTYRVI